MDVLALHPFLVRFVVTLLIAIPMVWVSARMSRARIQKELSNGRQFKEVIFAQRTSASSFLTLMIILILGDVITKLLIKR